MEREIDRCGMCGADLPGSLDVPLADRVGCPFCGSTHRLAGITMTTHVEAHGSISFKARRQGPGRPFLEGKEGDDLHRASGVWNRLRRVIDRENDDYLEHIEAPDGEVIRHVREPLSKHRDHGDAKHNESKPLP